ncbi:ERF family protein [Streptomyces sp. NPDC014779]|uniref:ERF family protein n=1 Tax=Streptomyces sp. NPDC014779 TaxID=3364911 RepID=UPI0036F5520F
MSTIQERAAAAAGRTTADLSKDDTAALPEEFAEQLPAADPMADYEPGDDDPEMVPVHLAWIRVRREIRAIGKGSEYNERGTRYNYRAADTVVQYFGPVTIKHGVNVIPFKTETTYGSKQTKSGSTMRECSVVVTWHIIGPKGDVIVSQTAGEALDTSDKSTTKAQTVALRNLLLNGGLIPTNDRDPDADRIERGIEAPARSAESYRDEILDPKTSQGRLQQIGYELGNLRMLNRQVQNETGEMESLDSLGRRVYAERSGGAQ